MREDFIFPPSFDGAPMGISLAGISYCDGSYHITRSKSTETVIEYVLEGEGYVTQNGRDTAVTAGKIYILKKGDDHNYYSSSENPWRKIFMNLYGDLPVRMLFEYNLQDSCIFDGHELKYLFDQIEQAVKRGDNSVECHARLCGIYVEIVTRLSIMQRLKVADPEAARVKEHLDSNTNRMVNNQELADIIFRSNDYMIKHFKKQYGLTPYEYQLREKINIACSLLKNSAMTVSEIAESVGYSDPHYFSGLFKSRRGQSPAKYRRSLRQ